MGRRGPRRSKPGSTLMLDSMRRGITNIFTKFLLALLIVAFAVWGVGDVVRRSGQTPCPWVPPNHHAIPAGYQTRRSPSSGDGGQPDAEQSKMLVSRPWRLARLIGFAPLTSMRANGPSVSETSSPTYPRRSAFQAPGQFSREQFRRSRQQGYQSEGYIGAHREILREQLTERWRRVVTHTDWWPFLSLPRRGRTWNIKTHYEA